jgi:recombination protein RecA
MSFKQQRRRQLDSAIAAIQQRYGVRAVTRGRAISPPVAYIPTGFPALDQALGLGGLPRGHVCELVGPATSGKTTLALKFLAQAQAAGARGLGTVGYIDQALYFDPDYAYRCGVDLSRLLVGTAHDLREALATTEALAHGGSLSALVLDVLDFLWADSAAAPCLAATFDRLPAFLERSHTALLVLRESAAQSVPALHQAAVRLHIVRERWIERYGDVRGYEARVDILRNRFGPEGRQVKIEIEFNGTVQGDGL